MENLYTVIYGASIKKYTQTTPSVDRASTFSPLVFGVSFTVIHSSFKNFLCEKSVLLVASCGKMNYF
jgi:hypothetical protein